MSLSISGEGNKCKEECEQKSDDEEMTKNDSSKRKQDDIEEAAVEEKEGLLFSDSESDPDLEKTKNGSSKRRKKDIKQAPTQQKGVLFFSSSEADSDLEETKNASSKPEKIVKDEGIERNEKDSDPEEMKTDVSKTECDDKGDAGLKKCSVMLDDIGPNQNSNNKRKPRKKIMKQQILVNNKKKKMSSSSNDECQVKSIQSDESVVISSDESLDSESEEKKKLSKLKPNKKIKSDHSENSMSSEEKKVESSVVVCSDSDSNAKSVKEEEDYMKNIDKSLFPLFFVKEEAYEKRKRQRIMRRMREKDEERNVAQLRTRKQVKYYESSGAESEDEEVEKVESNAGSENDDMGSDSDFDPDEYPDDDDDKSRKKETKTAEKETKASQKKDESNANEKPKRMTDYEKMLEDKRVQNLELLKSIGLLEAKSDFLESMTSKRKKRVYTKQEKPLVPAIKRVSKRAKALINYTEEARSQDSLIEKYNPTSVSFKKSLHISNIYENFLKHFSEVVGEIKEDNIAMIPVRYNKKDLQQMTLGYTTSKNSYQVASWYPSTENFILAVAGGSGGILSLWNISDEDLNFHTFSVHSRSVSCLQFNHSIPSHLISSSRAGTLVLGDMEKLMFTKILDVSPEIHHFDFFSPHTYLVALRSGEIVIVDGRKQNEGHHKRHACHEYDINTVNMHPVMKSYFVTAGKDKNVSVWDLRKLSNQPVLQITSHQKEVFSAFFSPITGNSLLTTSRDGTVRIFDCSSKTQHDLNTPKVLKCDYNMNKLKGRRRAVWLPNTDDHFSINIEMLNVYDKHFNLYHTVQDGLKSNRIAHVFHPFRKALASVTEIRCCVAT